MRRISLIAFLLVPVACDKNAAQTTTQQPNAQAQEGVGDNVVVIQESNLFISPTADAYVPHPGAGPSIMVNNAIGILSRGKAGTVLQQLPGWTNVKLDDAADGWVPANHLMPLKIVKGEATVIHSTPFFPDQSTTVGAGIVPPGSLLYIIQQGKPRTQVQLERVGMVYVPTNDLVLDDDEVEMSHMIVHARGNAQIGDVTEVSETFDDARLDHPDSPLLGIIADQVNFMNMHPTPYRSTSHMTESPFYRSFPMR